jgi:hypothetical protein
MGVDGDRTPPDDELDLERASHAMHRRAGLACRAASAAGLNGQFRAWELGGALAVLATDPALAFLSTIGWVTPRTVRAALHLIQDPAWTAAPSLTVAAVHDHELDPTLRSAGLVRTADRALAVRRLDTTVP